MSWIDWYTALAEHDMRDARVSRVSAIQARHVLYKHRIRHLSLSTRCIHSPHYGAINSLSIDKRGERYLLSAASDGRFCVYDLQSRMNNAQDTTKSRDTDQVIAPIKTALFETSSMRAGERSRSSPLCSIEWYSNDDGAFVITGINGTVQLWDAQRFEIVSSVNISSYPIYSASVGVTGVTQSTVAMCTSDNDVILYDMRSGDTSQKLTGHSDSITSAAWSPISPYQLSSASLDGSVKLWDVRKASYHGLLITLDRRQDHSTVFTSFSGSRHINQDENSLRVIKNIDWSKDQLARAHEGAVRCVKYTPCGRYLISSGNDCRIHLWQSSTGALQNVNYDSGCSSDLSYSFEIASFGHSASDLLIFPNGNTGDVSITPIHSPTGGFIKELKGHMSMVHSIAYRKATNEVITGGRDKMIYLWDCDSIPAYVMSPSMIRRHHTCKHSIHDGDLDEDADNWSDDEVVSHLPITGQRKSRKSSDLIEAEVSSKKLRYFVPPILQQYMSDAEPSNDNLNPQKPSEDSSAENGNSETNQSNSGNTIEKKTKKTAKLQGIQYLRKKYSQSTSRKR